MWLKFQTFDVPISNKDKIYSTFFNADNDGFKELNLNCNFKPNTPLPLNVLSESIQCNYHDNDSDSAFLLIVENISKTQSQYRVCEIKKSSKARFKHLLDMFIGTYIYGDKNQNWNDGKYSLNIKFLEIQKRLKLKNNPIMDLIYIEKSIPTFIKKMANANKYKMKNVLRQNNLC